MTHLNEKNEQTAKIIHIMVTSLCHRKCLHCCNNQYNLAEIPYVTDEELRDAHTICLIGGEPFAFTNPPEIAEYYKSHYPNIQKIYVYTNALELAQWLQKHPLLSMDSIDGLSVSIKNSFDYNKFSLIWTDQRVQKMNSNLLYVFNGLLPSQLGNFTVVERKWQEEFQPASDSIFRRV